MDKVGSVKLSQVKTYDLYKEAQEYDKVIALGEFASQALTKSMVPHFKLPHPSGLNRKLNDKNLIDKELSYAYDYVNCTFHHSVRLQWAKHKAVC